MKKISNQTLHIHPVGSFIQKDAVDGIFSIHQEKRNANTILVGKPQLETIQEPQVRE
jgi:hypothetical protein